MVFSDLTTFCERSLTIIVGMTDSDLIAYGERPAIEASNSAMNLAAFLLKCLPRRKRLTSHLTSSGGTVRAAGYC